MGPSFLKDKFESVTTTLDAIINTTVHAHRGNNHDTALIVYDNN